MEYINKMESESELLDRLIANYGPHKYSDLVHAMQWVRHLRHMEENHDRPLSELIEEAMIAIAKSEIPLSEIISAAKADAAADRRLAQRRSERQRQPETQISEEDIKRFSSEDEK